ncbi:MAG: hypothetical protein EOQ40_17395 [Mesorhizobium sp.]|uniref:hypothetical protein n=1 Tax=Mesorhizobium sp. TaxID=1871066 RepID=UPI000FE7D721|nr:hypothetical protein [Mesorhizobium sp.]RWB19910.1 MAG: hypothetical protein EOQ40_17395 [Mesorhizobium sp.]
MRKSGHSAVPLKNEGRSAYGIVEPADVKNLAKAVADYCASHKIERMDEREDIAIKVMSLFRRGITDPDRMLEELEKARNQSGPKSTN